MPDPFEATLSPEDLAEHYRQCWCETLAADREAEEFYASLPTHEEVEQMAKSLGLDELPF